MSKQSKIISIIFVVFIHLSSGLANAGDSSEVLATIFEEDQKDRNIMTSGEAYDWEAIAFRDEEREKIVRELIAKVTGRLILLAWRQSIENSRTP